jgi:hypothetical protein
MNYQQEVTMRATIKAVAKAREIYQGHELNVEGRTHRPLAMLTTLKEAPGFKLYRIGGEGIHGFLFIPEDQAKADEGEVEISLQRAE